MRGRGRDIEGERGRKERENGREGEGVGCSSLI